MMNAPCICGSLFTEWERDGIDRETFLVEEQQRVLDGHYASCNHRSSEPRETLNESGIVDETTIVFVEAERLPLCSCGVFMAVNGARATAFQDLGGLCVVCHANRQGDWYVGDRVDAIRLLLRSGPLTSCEIAHAMFLTPMDVASAVQRLESQGAAVRVQDHGSERLVLVSTQRSSVDRRGTTNE